MAGKISDLHVNIGAKTDDFKKGVKDVAQEGEKLGYSFKNVGKAVIGAFAASSVISFGKECSQLAQVAEGVEYAFKRIGDESMLEGLRKATKGTVSDLELMKAAVQAKNFGIPLQQLGSLLEFAHQRAKDTGQSVDYLVNSIVMGIGRKSPLILDNLGISAVQLKEKLGAVGTENANVGDIAKAVGQIASDAMAKIGTSAETSAEKTARVAAQWTNVKTELGKVINSFINELTPAMTTFLSRFTTFVKGVDKTASDMAEGQFSKIKDQIIELGKATDKTFDVKKSEAIKITGNQLSFLQKVAQQYAEEVKKIESVNFLFRDRKQLNLYKLSLSEVNKEINLLKKLRGDEIDKLLNQGISEATTPPIIDDTTELLGLLEAAKKKVEDLEKAITKAPSETIAGKLTKDLLTAQAELENLQKKIKIQAFGTPAASGLKPIEPIKATGVSTPDWKADQMAGMQEWANGYKSATDQVIEANEQVEVSMSGFATSFAEGLGGVLAGTQSIGDAFTNAMTGFMSQLGQQMIAVGFAKTVLDKLLLTPGGGVVAIAAGTALVALAGAARATMASGVKGGGGASRSASSGSYSGTGQKEMTVQIEGVVKGSEIYWSQKNYNNRLNSTISR